jgi:hypothetical protein
MLNDLEFALLGWGIKRFIERHRKVQIGSFASVYVALDVSV